MYTEASSTRIGSRLTTLFPSKMLEEHAEELGVSNGTANSRFRLSSGHSCSASPQARAEHSPLSDEATTVLLTRHSRLVASISG